MQWKWLGLKNNVAELLTTNQNEFRQQTKSLNRQEMFSLCHLNIISISNKFVSFKRLINTLHLPFHVLGLSEKWLNENNMDGFSLENFCI